MLILLILTPFCFFQESQSVLSIAEQIESTLGTYGNSAKGVHEFTEIIRHGWQIDHQHWKNEIEAYSLIVDCKHNERLVLNVALVALDINRSFSKIPLEDFDFSEDTDLRVLALISWLVYIKTDDVSEFIAFIESLGSRRVVKQLIFLYPGLGDCSIVEKFINQWGLEPDEQEFLNHVYPGCPKLKTPKEGD